MAARQSRLGALQAGRCCPPLPPCTHNALLAIHQQIEAAVVEPAERKAGAWAAMSHRGARSQCSTWWQDTCTAARLAVRTGQQLAAQPQPPHQAAGSRAPEVLIHAVVVIAVGCRARRAVAPPPLVLCGVQARHNACRRLLLRPVACRSIPVLVAAQAPHPWVLALQPASNGHRREGSAAVVAGTREQGGLQATVQQRAARHADMLSCTEQQHCRSQQRTFSCTSRHLQPLGKKPRASATSRPPSSLPPAMPPLLLSLLSPLPPPPISLPSRPSGGHCLTARAASSASSSTRSGEAIVSGLSLPLAAAARGALLPLPLLLPPLLLCPAAACLPEVLGCCWSAAVPPSGSPASAAAGGGPRLLAAIPAAAARGPARLACLPTASTCCPGAAQARACPVEHALWLGAAGALTKLLWGPSAPISLPGPAWARDLGGGPPCSNPPGSLAQPALCGGRGTLCSTTPLPGSDPTPFALHQQHAGALAAGPGRGGGAVRPACAARPARPGGGSRAEGGPRCTAQAPCQGNRGARAGGGHGGRPRQAAAAGQGPGSGGGRMQGAGCRVGGTRRLGHGHLGAPAIYAARQIHQRSPLPLPPACLQVTVVYKVGGAGRAGQRQPQASCTRNRG